MCRIQISVKPELLINQLIDNWPTFSLRSKHSRKKRTKFGLRVLVFRIRQERKMGLELKGGRNGGGGGGGAKKGSLARKPLDFEKSVRPQTGLLIGAAWSS